MKYDLLFRGVLTDTLAPSVTGAPRSGQTLTASAGSWLGETAISYSYQWESCNSMGGSCKNIEGATASTYLLGNGSAGDTLRVLVSASEAFGMVSRTSAATPPIASENNPVVEDLPGVSGTSLKGYALTASTGAWSGLAGSTTYSYQWERCGESGEGCSTISGATASTYTLTESDVGSTLRVLVTVTDEHGSTSAPSSATAVISRTALTDVAAPSISGTYAIDRALSADSGIWTGEGAITYSYTWELCNEKDEGCSTITGATEPTYTPSTGDAGKTLKVSITAEGTAGKESVTSAATPAIGSESLPPTDVIAPTVEGNLTSGETLTAQTGTWLSSEAISYSYQWQKCDEEGEGCANISGATSSTYKLIEEDINSTLRVLVTAKNSLGTASATSEASETVGGTGPPKNNSRPVINGTTKLGERLTARNGSWSGSRPLTYYYRWERCNTAGESCSAIEGATKPSYTTASADVGSTLRVKVTATNALGSVGAISTQTAVVAGSEASATSAIELAEKMDPSVLQPATADTIEGQETKPTVADSGEWLTGTTTLTTSTTSKETPGEFAVNTPAGELSFQPIGTAANAAQMPTIVNGAAAVYAGTTNATDTIVRPSPLGATALLQLHSSEAPTTFSWEVGLGPDQRLEKLANGDIAVLEVSETSPLEGSLGEALSEGEASEATAEHEGSGDSSEAAEKALEEGLSEESPLEKLPAAPTATTPRIEPKSGELHPQETKALYESSTDALTYAEEHTTSTTLMIIQAPTVMDAKGNTVTSSLSIENDTVTLTISPGGGTSYPVTAETNITAPTNQASEAKTHKVRYGLSDPKPSSFEQAEEEPGKTQTHFDNHLKNGPLHVGIARDIIPYTTNPENSTLDKWLEAVKTAGLQPYITFTAQKLCEAGQPCIETKLSSYEKGIKELITGLMKLHKEKPSAIPAITLWGAWNEPDLNKPLEKNPLYKNPKRAAVFWKAARAILRQAGCNCTLVAGEFSEDDGYINKYLTTIQKDHSLWAGKPHVWGFHDYEDLEHYYYHPYNSYAEAFIKKIKRLGASHVWFSEQGVMLQNGGAETKLDNSSQPEDEKRQRDAAKDFLKLGDVHLSKETSRVELVDYYLYKGPDAEVLKEPHHEHTFDSALLPGEGVTTEQGHPAENPRQAYCVLALGLEGCLAASKTKTAVASTITSTGGTVTLAVNPEGSPTKYLVEYGTTEAYGKNTTAVAVANENGEQSETAALSGLESCTTYHYQAVAENKANEEEKQPGLGGDKTFKTGCPATSIASQDHSACAGLASGTVYCWGEDSDGQLGNGRTELEALPGEVTELTGASQISGRDEQPCALLSSGGIDCWGDDSDVPVAVTGITTATSVDTATGSGSLGSHACASLKSGAVECWGSDVGGMLGNGRSSGTYSSPVEASGITNAVSVSVGGDASCAVLSTGHVDCWGETTDFPFIVKKEGSSVPVEIEGISTAEQVSVGEGTACAVLADGHIECWGYGEIGYLGTGELNGPELCGEDNCSRKPLEVTGISDASSVSIPAGELGAPCAVLTTGSVKCWGDGEDGGFGNGEKGEKARTGTPVEVSDIKTATAVATGGSYGATCALLSGGTVDCWGMNLHGALGYKPHESEEVVPTPVEVGGI
jgi:alpha-tubulin suppressor-like RCC1 family protein